MTPTDLPNQSEQPGFVLLLSRLATGFLIAATLWGGVVLVCVLLEALSDGRLRVAHLTGCPISWRTSLLGLCLALVPTLATPATAAEQPGPIAPAPATLDGLSLPDRPTDDPQKQHRTSVAVSPIAGAANAVVVRAGDSLWEIARSRLRGEADVHEVAAAVIALYQRNRRVIGTDPDLILPGQWLRLPSSHFPTTDTHGSTTPQPQEIQ